MLQAGYSTEATGGGAGVASGRGAGNRCCWSGGAGAAGVTPRVDGVQVELRERAGAAIARPGAAASADLCSPWPGEKEKSGGLDAPRARAAGRAEAFTERSANVEMSRGRFGWGANPGLEAASASTRWP